MPALSLASSPQRSIYQHQDIGGYLVIQVAKLVADHPRIERRVIESPADVLRDLQGPLRQGRLDTGFSEPDPRLRRQSAQQFLG